MSDDVERFLSFISILLIGSEQCLSLHSTLHNPLWRALDIQYCFLPSEIPISFLEPRMILFDILRNGGTMIHNKMRISSSKINETFKLKLGKGVLTTKFPPSKTALSELMEIAKHLGSAQIRSCFASQLIPKYVPHSKHDEHFF